MRKIVINPMIERASDLPRKSSSLSIVLRVQFRELQANSSTTFFVSCELLFLLFFRLTAQLKTVLLRSTNSTFLAHGRLEQNETGKRKGKTIHESGLKVRCWLDKSLQTTERLFPVDRLKLVSLISCPLLTIFVLSVSSSRASFSSAGARRRKSTVGRVECVNRNRIANLNLCIFAYLNVVNLLSRINW